MHGSETMQESSSIEIKAMTPTVGLTSLPREVRDDIYTLLLKSTYRVAISPAMRHNAPGLVPYNQKTIPVHKETAAPLFAFELPSRRTAILQVSKAIGEDAREELYRCSTFVFHIGIETGQVNPTFDHIYALQWMKNIEIRLDLVTAMKYGKGYNKEQLAERTALQAAKELLLNYAHKEARHNSCVLHIRHYNDSMHLVQDLGPTISLLTGFKTVEIRLCGVLYTSTLFGTNSSRFGTNSSLFGTNYSHYALMSAQFPQQPYRPQRPTVYTMDKSQTFYQVLKDTLGPMEFHRNGMLGEEQVLIYHPRQFVEEAEVSEGNWQLAGGRVGSAAGFLL